MTSVGFDYNLRVIDRFVGWICFRKSVFYNFTILTTTATDYIYLRRYLHYLQLHKTIYESLIGKFINRQQLTCRLHRHMRYIHYSENQVNLP